MAFLWFEEHQHAFTELKTSVIRTLELNHFDTEWETQLVTDASRLQGLGFVLLQTKGKETKVVQCGSRSTSSAEKNYSTLELELTAIVWAIGKCRFFLKGLEGFKVVTDHRPLVGIFAKPMQQIDNTRITRLRERVMDYAFQVKWMAGKENVIADALSRAPAPTTEGATAIPINTCVIAPQDTIENIVKSARECSAYAQIVEAFKRGRRMINIPSDHPAKHLKGVWDDVSLTDDGIIMVGSKIYIPQGARQLTLRQLHKGHCVFGTTLQTAREL